MINHQDNFGTNLTSGTSASDTTSPLNSIPSIAAPFYIAFDATNINNHYETKLITSKTATNVLHSALSYDHTTAEEVRMVVPAVELDAYSAAIESPTGWNSISATLTFSSADAPTYVCTTSSDMTGSIGVGMRIKLTHSASTKYFIVTAIDASTITLYGGTDYTLAATAITAPYYSNVKAPLGFPLDPTKWSVTVTDSTQRIQAGPSAATWYNIGTTNSQITIPIGVWDVFFKYNIENTSQSTGKTIKITLSTANNSESNSNMTCAYEINSASGLRPDLNAFARDTVVLAAKTTHYLNGYDSAGSGSLDFRNDLAKGVIRAVCAYL